MAAIPHPAGQSHEAAAAQQFMLKTTELTADEVQPIGPGYAVRTPSLPHVWSLNHLRITKTISVDRVVALADEHLSYLGYRQLYVEDQSSGPELQLALRRAGWRTEREVVMALKRGPDREADTSSVREADEPQMLELMRRWYLDGPQEISAEALLELAEHTRRETRARRDRTFGVTGRDGRFVAMTKLRSDGTIAQVEDVYTAPEARGRGYARALVSHAVSEALSGSHDLIFIVANDEDWPKQLYGRIGFDPIAYAWAFHRDVA